MLLGPRRIRWRQDLLRRAEAGILGLEMTARHRVQRRGKVHYIAKASEQVAVMRGQRQRSKSVSVSFLCRCCWLSAQRGGGRLVTLTSKTRFISVIFTGNSSNAITSTKQTDYVLHSGDISEHLRSERPGTIISLTDYMERTCCDDFRLDPFTRLPSFIRRLER
jgi:hypothetical protein